jgi:methyl-accepting chemotaxis protein
MVKVSAIPVETFHTKDYRWFFSNTWDSTAMNKLKISTKLTIFGLGVFSVVLIALTILVQVKTSAMVKQLGIGEITNESNLIRDQLITMNATLKGNADRLSGIFYSMFPQGLSVDSSQTVVINGNAVPVVKSGGKILNLDFSAVDQIRTMSGGVATIFVRSGDDFLRVTTSLKKEDGSRALGTFLGKESPAYKPVMAGETYFGKARLFGSDYMTKYSPIKDKQGKVVGIVFVGTEYTEALKQFKDQIRADKIGEKGYFYIFDNADGKNKGNIIVHPNSEGKNAFTDNQGEHYRRISEQKTGIIEYTSAHGSKIAAFTTVPEWNWIIVAAADSVEFEQNAISLRNIQLSSSTLALLLCGILLFVVVTRTLQPLSDMVEDVAKVGQGDMTVRCKHTGYDEVGALGIGINKMAGQIGLLISEVSKSVNEVHGASATLLKNAQDIEYGSLQQSEAASATAAAIEELAVSINQVMEHASNTESLSTRSSNFSIEGEQVVKTASNEMSQIASMVVQSSRAINALGHKSNEISNIVTVIKDIAEQTNLLALNAAIEAARAGEQGRGFAVVADEVRKLAERTSRATAEIGGMIIAIQQDMGAAVTGMQEGNVQVDRGVESANQAATALSSINDAAKETLSNITDIVSAMREQSTASQEIAQHIEKIAGMADANCNVIKGTTVAANQLEVLASNLRLSLSRFCI